MYLICLTLKFTGTTSPLLVGGKILSLKLCHCHLFVIVYLCIFSGSENSDTTSCPDSLGEDVNMKDLIMINKGNT